MRNKKIECIAVAITLLFLSTSIVQATLVKPVDKVEAFSDLKNSPKYQEIISSIPFDKSKITVKEAIFLLKGIEESSIDIRIKSTVQNVIALLQTQADLPYTLCEFLMDTIRYMIFGPYEYPDLLVFLLILIYMAFCL